MRNCIPMNSNLVDMVPIAQPSTPSSRSNPPTDDLGPYQQRKGVTNCYVFKSRLQEYAQKVGLATPVYDTVKEGPSHEPIFRSSVVVNGVRYDSLPGFFNRKAAEQSAAEIALMELAKSGDMKECISQPVQQTGLCKNLLQEYAQKMNYAIPSYECHKDETPGKIPFSCTVEIGGIRYIGAGAKTKKEAELKAARTALLAIQSSAPELCVDPIADSKFTVVPQRKKPSESAVNSEAASKSLKAKKEQLKKKCRKKNLNKKMVGQAQPNDMGVLGISINGQVNSDVVQNNASGCQVMDTGKAMTLATEGFQNGTLNVKQNKRELDFSPVERVLAPHLNASFHYGQFTTPSFCQNGYGAAVGVSPVFPGRDFPTLVSEASQVSGVGQNVGNSMVCCSELSSTEPGLCLKHEGEAMQA